MWGRLLRYAPHEGVISQNSFFLRDTCLGRWVTAALHRCHYGIVQTRPFSVQVEPTISLEVFSGLALVTLFPRLKLVFCLFSFCLELNLLLGTCYTYDSWFLARNLRISKFSSAFRLTTFLVGAVLIIQALHKHATLKLYSHCYCRWNDVTITGIEIFHRWGAGVCFIQPSYRWESSRHEVTSEMRQINGDSTRTNQLLYKWMFFNRIRTVPTRRANWFN